MMRGFKEEELRSIPWEPIYYSEDDGMQYKAEKLVDFEFLMPQYFNQKYKPTHPLTWFLKGVVFWPLFIVWLLCFGVWISVIGIVASVFAESWDEMQERRKND